MTKNNVNTDVTFRGLVRIIVREELRSMFLNNQAEVPTQPRIFSKKSSSTNTPRKGPKGKSTLAKGRVTDPSTDKRLKVNRVGHA